VHTSEIKTLGTSNLLNSPDYHWREHLLLLFTALLGLMWIYQGTLLSLISLWQSSETYAHGFIIYPISMYIIWRQRVYLSSFAPCPSVLGIVALTALCLGWMVAQSAGVQVVAQYMFVAMIPALTASILGLRITRILAFPLLFTLLAVPFGEIFIRPLIDFTADFTVFALKTSGIPVFREGSQFTIPSGSWSVVEACSGLRYLIASFTLGSLYAYLTYRSRIRQLIFVALSIIVPIFANGLRAYLIVLIGHFSNMQLAVGIDHLIYGWVFFGLVMLVLFWVGSRWREDDLIDMNEAKTLSSNTYSITSPPLKVAGFAAVALFLSGMSPVYLHHLEQQTFNPDPVIVTLPQTIGTWVASPSNIGLNPVFRGATTTVLQEYRNGNHTIGIYVAFFRNQHTGAEAVSSQNKLADEKSNEWSLTGKSVKKIHNEPKRVLESRLSWGNHHLLAWQWYWIGGTQTSNSYAAKWIQAKQRLSGKGDDSANIVIFSPYDLRLDDISEAMDEFIAQSSSKIQQSLEQARGK